MQICRSCGTSEGLLKGRRKCVDCMKNYKKSHHLANKDKHNAASKQWHNAHREETSKRRKAEYAADPEPARKRARKRQIDKPELVKFEQRRKHLKSTYNLTLEEYDVKLVEQGGGCGLCGGPPTVHGRFYVDHDHETGVIRALLCHACNVGLGMFKDRPSLCEKAAVYLRKYGKLN